MSFLYFLHKSVSSGKYNNNSNKKCQQTEQNRQPSEWKDWKKIIMKIQYHLLYVGLMEDKTGRIAGNDWIEAELLWLTLRSVCVSISYYYHSNHFHAESGDTPSDCPLGFSAVNNVCNSPLLRSYTARASDTDSEIRDTPGWSWAAHCVWKPADEGKEWIPNREIEKDRKKDEMNITRHDTTCNEITPEIRWVFSFLLLITYFWGKIVIVKYKNHLHTHSRSHPYMMMMMVNKTE